MNPKLLECLEEIDATLELFSIPRDYHGSEKHSKEWHAGWESAAHDATLTLRMVRHLIRSELEIK